MTSPETSEQSVQRAARSVSRARAASRGIPDATVARLPVYLRALGALADEGVSTVSSEELAAAAGVNSAKLRKDLSYLGLLRHPRRRLRRRVPRLPDLPRARR